MSEPMPPDFITVDLRAGGRDPSELRLTVRRMSGLNPAAHVDNIAGVLTLEEEKKLLQRLLDRAHHRGDAR